MSDKRLELTRRKILAGLGTIGAASAGVGLGTSAYFSDRETFTNNGLVAGSLDLKVDWEEHYHLTNEQVTVGDDEPGIVMSDPDDTNYVGFPDPQNPMVWVHVDALEAYMDLTALEAFPDHDNDGVQSEPEEYDVCEDGADTPEDLDPMADTALRTLNEDTYDAETEEPRPLIDLEDVKPGDFGELTLSLHLCDNPGYVWMFADNVAWAENGVTEPEAKDPDEGEGVELMDAIQTVWWYDADGDNVLDEDEEVIFRGTLMESLEALTTDNGIPLDGNLETAYDETGAIGDETNDEYGVRDCFDPSTTAYIGFAWWLPVDHANEIQTDSVQFDLGFYTEQCRHNDGSGIVETIDLSTGVADWQVVQSPDGTTGPAVVTDPHPAWATAECASWIDPYGNDPQTTDPPGEYVYEVDFTIDPSTAVDTLLLEKYGSDNTVEFYLDGTAIGTSGGANAFTSLKTNIGSVENLDAGTHTLRAVVQNGSGATGNPTGLLVCAHVE